MKTINTNDKGMLISSSDTMQIEMLEFSGLSSALQALRLPYNLGVRSICDNRIKNNGLQIGTNTNVRIEEKDLDLIQALIRRGDEHAKVLRGVLAYIKIDAPIYFFWDLETYIVGHQRLMSGSTMNTEGKNLSGKELQEALNKISFGRVITKIDYFSYQTLRRIYIQRKNHRKPEFQQFCEFIENLPLAKELITL